MNVPTQITQKFDNATAMFVDTNERVLDAVVDVNRRVVDTAVRMNQDITDRAPRIELPVATMLPTPAQTGARYLDFVDRAVSVNREFTAKVIAQLPIGVATTAKSKSTTAAK